MSGGRLESEEAVSSSVSSSLSLEETSEGQLQSEEAISSSSWLLIDTGSRRAGEGGCRLGWALGLALSTSACVFVVVVLMLMFLLCVRLARLDFPGGF